jgi:large subunit ribosomal protein L6
MSRLAKKPILLPAGVTCTLDGSLLTLTGSKGTLSYSLPATIVAKVEDNTILLSSTVSEGKEFAYWGLAWALIRSKIIGVSEGFKKDLELQ